jgi:ribosomal-protein-alanine N-acetyltransferase
VDRELFGDQVDWVSRPLTVDVRRDGRLVGLASGELVAGMVRLNDLMVARPARGRGVGAELVEAFCAEAARAGAARCFLRCPATERHARFYERLGFTRLATIPRYYHDMDFYEYVRDPVV